MDEGGYVSMPRNISAPQTVTRSEVLSKAVIRAAEHLGLSQAKVAEILGVSAATSSRLFSGTYQLTPERKKEWELAILLVRLFRSLDAMVGGIAEDAIRWFDSKNSALAGQRPTDMIITTEGLVRVVNYLDARRGII
jgi:transcriptional regulator with XRE-family HTH domain